MLSALKHCIFIKFGILKRNIKDKAQYKWHYNYFPKSIIKAFTLAEVLVTLLLIGVVSSLVIPPLISDTQNAEYKTAWKKAYSTIDQATSRIIMDNRGTLVGAFNNSADMINKYSSYLNYTKICADNTNCWHKINKWTWYNKSPIHEEYPGLILSDGTLLAPRLFSSNCTDTTDTGNIQKCGWFFVDVNGFKGPNTVDKDIFYIYILKDRTTPRGATGDDPNYDVCGNKGGCSSQYLYQ